MGLGGGGGGQHFGLCFISCSLGGSGGMPPRNFFCAKSLEIYRSVPHSLIGIIIMLVNLTIQNYTKVKLCQGEKSD